MDRLNKVHERAETARRKAIKALERLAEKGVRFDLPAPQPALEQCRIKMAENRYKVLVVGEAKRGKSSFINAIIGRDILPTEQQIATSQVFCVSQAERESYRLRFEDGSEKPITLADLPRYGSQEFADEQGEPQLSETIKWIEVEVPVRFLPKGLALLDTPGTGSMYVRHAQITHRYAREADAIIFVLDSEKPIIQEELDFLNMILGVTRSVFFIQTKIDAFSKDTWEEIQRRNQEVLRQKFSDRLPDNRVWPISNLNLRKAAKTESEQDADDYIMVSRHKELAAALQAFLARVADWSRTVDAMLLAEQYHSSSRKILSTRSANLSEESKKKRAEFQKMQMHRNQQFDADWGERGQKRKEAMDRIRKVITAAKINFRQAMEPGSEIIMALESKIDQLKSVKNANHLHEMISSELTSRISEEWQQICDQVKAQCLQVLSTFIEDAEAVQIGIDQKVAGPAGVNQPRKRFKDDRWARIKNARVDFYTASGLSDGFLLFASILMIPVSAPVSLALWFGIAVATIRGLFKGGEIQVRNAQQESRKYLNQLVQQVRRHFFEVNIKSSYSNRVDEYFDDLEKNLSERIHAIAKLKLEESQVEIARLSKEDQLNEEERKAKAAQSREQLAEWDALGLSIREVISELKELDKSMAVPVAS
jgi:predicted GTPase